MRTSCGIPRALRCSLAIVVIAGAAAAPAATTTVPTVDFGRDIYPIFRRACFECHGPHEQKGNFRLDVRERAFRSEGIIVKSNALESDLYYRITLPKNHDDAMPNRGEPLSKTDTELVKAWIEAGAPWPDGVKPAPHWAYVKPVRPPVPGVPQASGAVRNAIDAFILARLAHSGLRPSPEADPATLCRRIYFDLIGLPPSPAEVDAFLQAVRSSGEKRAYETLVDRLLALPQFGERWARPWLDLARYADSHGYQKDDLRDIWPYRDWVVRALNADMPFDQFTIEQIAGDLLPNPTEAQRVATGFNRCLPTNIEAGADPEETRVGQVFDRINTLGAVWLGTTFECAQCHDHKYDPVTQKDYYQLFAFFNTTISEVERRKPTVPASIAFVSPYLELKNPERERQRSELQQQAADAKASIAARETELAATAEAFEAELREQVTSAAREHPLEIADFVSAAGAAHTVLDDQSLLLTEEAPDKDSFTLTVKTRLTNITGFKLEAMTHPSLPGKGPGRGDALRPNFVVNRFTITAAAMDGTGSVEPVKLVRALASFSQRGYEVENLLSHAGDKPRTGGWAIAPQFRQDHWALFVCERPVGLADGTMLTFRIEQNFGNGRTLGRLRLTALTGKIAGPSIPAEVAAALATPKSRRTPPQTRTLAAYQARHDKPMLALQTRLRAAEQRMLVQQPDRTLVMQERTEPRATTIFNRGAYTDPGEPVDPGVPAFLHPLATSASARPNRLDLARWLVDPENPLVARVAVNRWWAELFGRGIVGTIEDFGLKGEPPMHPELLDWLAVELMENGWSAKKLLKTMVMSATYRQSSIVTAELAAGDDQNKLLARGPRFRMDAEMIRDNALATAGLLSLKQGGPPIRPYQPEGLWVKVGGQKYDYVVSPGDEKYRRGLYVVLKRGAPYPSFMNFDASARMTCKVKRSRSNTPLQALTLLNDPVYVEAAMALARRVVVERAGASANARIAYAFRLCVARPPSDAEVASLKRLLEAELAANRADAKAANELLGSVALPPGIGPDEFAAWYAVASALLNLDETITKG